MKDFENPRLCFEAEIGTRIRQKRIQRKISQIDFAALIGVHRNQLHRWECGTEMSLWEFLRVCDELSVTPEAMMPARELYLGQVLRQAIKEREAAVAALTADDQRLLEKVKAERDPLLTLDERVQLRKPVVSALAERIAAPGGGEMIWVQTRDGDVKARRIFHRHYSYRPYKDGRMPKLFVGPGEKMVLIAWNLDALFVWRKFICGDGNKGINCAVFRNEGQYLSSDLIREADALADERWPGARHYTYVNPRKVASRNPGYCFEMAGWRKCGVTKARKLLILERQ